MADRETAAFRLVSVRPVRSPGAPGADLYPDDPFVSDGRIACRLNDDDGHFAIVETPLLNRQRGLRK